METPTQTLHRLTSYTPGRRWDQPADDPGVVQGLRTNDMDRFPWFYKHYPQGLPRQALPVGLPPTAAPALAVLAGTAEMAPGRLDLAQLSRLLYLSAGVVRVWLRPSGNWLFRAAGSAGGRFPLELYAAVPQGGALPAGKRVPGRPRGPSRLTWRGTGGPATGRRSRRAASQATWRH